MNWAVWEPRTLQQPIHLLLYLPTGTTASCGYLGRVGVSEAPITTAYIYQPAQPYRVGICFMGEPASVRLVTGVAAVIAGVYIASNAKTGESAGDSDGSDGGKGGGDGGIALGYALAVGHLAFDTVGASITKRFSGALGPLQIGGCRNFTTLHIRITITPRQPPSS